MTSFSGTYNGLPEKFEGYNSDGGSSGPGIPGKDGKDGKDGFSPTVSVELISGGHEVTITDVSGPKSFDVMNGVDGTDGKDGKNATINGLNTLKIIGGQGINIDLVGDELRISSTWDTDVVSYVIEEYLETVDNCEWLVRKFNNGYCELSGTKSYEDVAIDNVWGTSTSTTSPYYVSIPRINLPLTLTKKYVENVFPTNCSNGTLVGVNVTSTSADELIKTSQFICVSSNKRTGASFVLNIFINGRWK